MTPRHLLLAAVLIGGVGVALGATDGGAPFALPVLAVIVIAAVLVLGRDR